MLILLTKFANQKFHALTKTVLPLLFSGCPLPVPTVENAIHSLFISRDGRRAIRYQCDKGFQIHGNSEVPCLGKVWDKLPHCEPVPSFIEAPTVQKSSVACGPLPPVQNGFFEIISTPNGDMAAKFKCLPGYALSGNNLVYCESSGNWPEDLPSCLGKFSYSI